MEAPRDIGKFFYYLGHLENRDVISDSKIDPAIPQGPQSDIIEKGKKEFCSTSGKIVTNKICFVGVQTVGRKTSWAKDVWANYFLGDRRLGDNRHFKKDVSAKDG